MELWIPITIAAAFSQNLRSALQKQLTASLSTWGSTAARFVFAAPLAVGLAAVLIARHDQGLPELTPTFFAYGAVGGIAQIVATGFLIHLFSQANFSVATAYTKTEPIQTALFGIVLLGDRLSPGIVFAILISLVGVVMISVPREGFGRRAWLNKTALIGIVAGSLFGLSAVAYRGASLSLDHGDAFFRASVALAYVALLQTVLILAWLRLTEPGQTRALLGEWRMASLVGLTGMLGSLAWFTAFTLQNAAHVRALGQIEVIFTLAASVFIFRERVTAREVIGVGLVSLGIVALILFSD